MKCFQSRGWPVTLSAVLLLFFLGFLAFPAAASPALQSTPQATPTPGADGRILYTVQAGDSQWLIAAKFNIAIEELRILNGWTADETLVEGEMILLGLAGQATATAGPTSA